MTDQSEPREWWVYGTSHGKNISGGVNMYSATDQFPQNPGWVHVIEKRAYDELKAEHDRYRTQSETYALELLEAQRERDQLLAQANKLAEALEGVVCAGQYAAHATKRYLEVDRPKQNVIKTGTPMRVAAERAEKALKQWNEWKDKK